MDVLEELPGSEGDFLDTTGFTAFLIVVLVSLLVYQPLAIYFSVSLLSRHLNVASIVSIWVAVPCLILDLLQKSVR
jgi:hypothetical protein